jgi:hypothetical protein
VTSAACEHFSADPTFRVFADKEEKPRWSEILPSPDAVLLRRVPIAGAREIRLQVECVGPSSVAHAGAYRPRIRRRSTDFGLFVQPYFSLNAAGASLSKRPSSVSTTWRIPQRVAKKRPASPGFNR